MKLLATNLFNRVLLVSTEGDEFVFVVQRHWVGVLQLKRPNAGHRLQREELVSWWARSGVWVQAVTSKVRQVELLNKLLWQDALSRKTKSLKNYLYLLVYVAAAATHVSHVRTHQLFEEKIALIQCQAIFQLKTLHQFNFDKAVDELKVRWSIIATISLLRILELFFLRSGRRTASTQRGRPPCRRWARWRSRRSAASKRSCWRRRCGRPQELLSKPVRDERNTWEIFLPQIGLEFSLPSSYLSKVKTLRLTWAKIVAHNNSKTTQISFNGLPEWTMEPYQNVPNPKK